MTSHLELKEHNPEEYTRQVPKFKQLLGLLPIDTLRVIKEAKDITAKIWDAGDSPNTEDEHYFDGGAGCSCYCGFALRCAVGIDRGNGPITPRELRNWSGNQDFPIGQALWMPQELDRRYGGGVDAWHDLYWTASQYKEVYIGAALEELLAEVPTAFEESIATREPDYAGAYDTFRGVIAYWPPEWIESRDHFNKLLDALLDTALPGWQGIEDESL